MQNSYQLSMFVHMLVSGVARIKKYYPLKLYIMHNLIWACMHLQNIKYI